MEKTIRIEGLSWQQRVFADILWSLEGQEEVNTFIRSLPKSMQAEAESIKQMMIAAMFDQVDDTDIAEERLNKFR